MFFYRSGLSDIITFKVLNMINNPSLGIQPFEAQAQLLKVLTHPARLAILNILHDGEHCVCHMEAHLGYRQAYISQQLMVLREAGLIQDRRDGWNVFYRVTEPHIFAVLSAVEQMVAPDKAGSPHGAPVACPCPQCNPG
jgi:DNA-binding transcriptional ArsR family regulator